MKFKPIISNRGFSLVELLVTMALSGIVMASIYSTFYSQQKQHVVQSQITAMQQNLRSAMYFMENETRMAGYDPIGSAGAGILTANADKIRVTMDLTDNSGTGDPDGTTDDDNEDITYSLYDCDGDLDNDLGKDTGTGNQPVAENIDTINFVYLDEKDKETSTLSQIRSVQISIVAKTGKRDPGYINNNIYSNQQGTVIYTATGDNYRRRFLTAQVRCRNIGID